MMKPYSNVISSLFWVYFKSNYFPSFLIKNLAPGHSFGPLITNYLNLSIFSGVTTSGNVRLRAMDLGTPNSSIAILGSGETTVLAEKSTLFPIKFFLNLPSLPLSLSLKDLIGLPLFNLAYGNPDPNSLFIKVAT